MKNKEKWFKTISVLLVLIFALALGLTLVGCGDQDCIQCMGTGKCYGCNGNGFVTSTEGTYSTYCGLCYTTGSGNIQSWLPGDGKCRECQGTGKK